MKNILAPPQCKNLAEDGSQPGHGPVYSVIGECVLSRSELTSDGYAIHSYSRLPPHSNLAPLNPLDTIAGLYLEVDNNNVIETVIGVKGSHVTGVTIQTLLTDHGEIITKRLALEGLLSQNMIIGSLQYNSNPKYPIVWRLSVMRKASPQIISDAIKQLAIKAENIKHPKDNPWSKVFDTPSSEYGMTR